MWQSSCAPPPCRLPPFPARSAKNGRCVQRPGLKVQQAWALPRPHQPSRVQGAELVKGRLLPWHRRPPQAPGRGRCQQLSGSCAQAAGGRPVKGPPPAPRHTSDSEECVCVCASDSFKGKKLALGRIPAGTPAAGEGSRAAGLMQGPWPLGPPASAPRNHKRPVRRPSLRKVCGPGSRAGWGVGPRRLQIPAGRFEISEVSR